MAEEDPDGKITKDQYGRKKWNVEAYAAEAKRAPKRRANTTTDSSQYSVSAADPNSYLSHRDQLLKESVESVKQHTLLADNKSVATVAEAAAAGAVPGKRTRLFGFFCPVCEFSFRDNMALIDHLNSPQHIEKVRGSYDGELNAGVRRATVDEVKEMLQHLVAQANKQAGAQESFVERTRRREEFERNRLRARRAKRARSKARAKAKQHASLAAGAGGDEPTDFAQMMGFTGFGTTKR